MMTESHFATTATTRRDNPDPVLTAAEVATDLRCSKAHVYNVIKGKVDGVMPMPVTRMGRRSWFAEAALNCGSGLSRRASPMLLYPHCQESHRETHGRSFECVSGIRKVV